MTWPRFPDGLHLDRLPRLVAAMPDVHLVGRMLQLVEAAAHTATWWRTLYLVVQAVDDVAASGLNLVERRAMMDESARERFLGWSAERLVDEIIRLEDALIRQASRAECAWCHRSMPIAEATEHVRTCTYRPQSGSAIA